MEQARGNTKIVNARNLPAFPGLRGVLDGRRDE